MLAVQYIKHPNIDFKKWDETILSSEYPLVFAQSFYLNATSPGWDALIIGDYSAVFPITAKKKLGFNYLPQPSFTSQLGAFGKISPEIELTFYDYIVKHFKLIEIELNASNKINVKGVSAKKTFIIDYKNDYSYNQNTKRNIKKAHETNLVVDRVKNEDVVTLSKKWINPFLKSELNLSNSVITTFNNLLLNCLKEEHLLSYTTKGVDGTMKAMAHFVYNNKHVLYLKGTSFDKKDNSGSMHLLMDAAINHFKNKASVFDFGGGAKDSLASFYKGLGGTQLDYSFLKVNQLPKIINALKGKKN